MKIRTTLSAAAVGILPLTAAAGTITQTVPFDYRPLEGTTFLDVARFDTLGGTRELTGVTFAFQHNFSADLFIESTGPTALQAGDFGINMFFISIFQVGTVDPGNPDDSPPFFGPGGWDLLNVTAPLAAYDGVPGNNGPDSSTQNFTDAYANSVTILPDEQPVLDALTGSGTLTTVYGGFTELMFFWENDPNWPFPPDGDPAYPDDAAIWVDVQNFRHFGQIEITYDYVNIPAPASASVLLGLGMLTRRRRR